MSINWWVDEAGVLPQNATLRQEFLDFHQDIRAIRFWGRRRGPVGGTSLHVAVCVLLTLIFTVLGIVITLQSPRLWPLTIDLASLPAIYTIFNLIEYWQEPYW